jgi:hypothetical protein
MFKGGEPPGAFLAKGAKGGAEASWRAMPLAWQAWRENGWNGRGSEFGGAKLLRLGLECGGKPAMRATRRFAWRLARNQIYRSR